MTKSVKLPCGLIVSERSVDYNSAFLELEVKSPEGKPAQANGIIITRKSIPAIIKFLGQFAPRPKRRKP